MHKIRELCREWDAMHFKRNELTELEAERYEELNEIFQCWEHYKGCPYGQADGPDDINKDCECAELEE